jgi:hypothetical protein
MIAGCKTTSTTSSSVEKDSTVYADFTFIQDTVITVPGDFVDYTIFNICDSAGILRDFETARKGNLKANSSIKSNPKKNSLDVACNCDAEKIIIEEQKREIAKSQLIIKEKDTAIKETVPVRHIPAYARWYWYAVAILVSYIAGVFKLHNLIFKLFKSFF